MKGFKFGLERVLRYKDLIVGQREAELREAAEKHNSHRRQLARLEELMEQRRKEFFAGRLEPHRLIHRSAAIQFLQQQIIEQKKLLVQASKKVRESRGRLVEAKQEHQVLEKLKERHLLEYGYEMAKREQKELDEIATSAYIRRSI
ncbi:MAG: flagellar export protein FliJ [Clostridia bacterium]|nr:flagellar export protein FliJ [Clostridia bacterium]